MLWKTTDAYAMVSKYRDAAHVHRRRLRAHCTSRTGVSKGGPQHIRQNVEPQGRVRDCKPLGPATVHEQRISLSTTRRFRPRCPTTLCPSKFTRSACTRSQGDVLDKRRSRSRVRRGPLCEGRRHCIRYGRRRMGPANAHADTRKPTAQRRSTETGGYGTTRGDRGRRTNSRMVVIQTLFFFNSTKIYDYVCLHGIHDYVFPPFSFPVPVLVFHVHFRNVHAAINGTIALSCAQEYHPF